MKFLYALLSIVGWVLGISMLLFATIGIFVGSGAVEDIIMIVFLSAIGIIFIMFGKNMLKKSQRLASPKKPIARDKIKTTSAKPKESDKQIIENQKTKVKFNVRYQPFAVERKGIQLLESLSLLGSTKNIDTLTGRIDFINDMYDFFIESSKNGRYISDIQNSIDVYKQMYYDRVIKDYELKLVVAPNYQDLGKYYAECICACFFKYAKDQDTHIAKLKRESAKRARMLKIISNADDTIMLIEQHAGSYSIAQDYILQIESKRDSYNKLITD